MKLKTGNKFGKEAVMEKRLLDLIKDQAPSIDTIGIILSNNIDFGCDRGALMSVKKFDDVATDIIEYYNAYYGDCLRLAVGTEQQLQPDNSKVIPMTLELCPFCKMPKRDERTIKENESMVFYECGTTEILKISKSQFQGLIQSREVYSQKSACREICRLRNTIESMRHKTDA